MAFPNGHRPVHASARQRIGRKPHGSRTLKTKRSLARYLRLITLLVPVPSMKSQDVPRHGIAPPKALGAALASISLLERPLPGPPVDFQRFMDEADFKAAQALEVGSLDHRLVQSPRLPVCVACS